MTTENNETPETNPTNETNSAANGGWGKWVAVGAVAAMLVGGAGIASAISDDSGHGYKRFGFEQSREMGSHHSGFMRVHMGMRGHGIERALDAIDATDEQADKIYEIMDEARSEFRPLFREFRDTRDDLKDILSAETIDRAALETLRSERVAALDNVSKTMTDALLEAADVLTPEQRAELVKLFEEHGGRGMRGRW